MGENCGAKPEDMKDMLQQDEYGLYVNAPNYHDVKQRMVAEMQFNDREKLSRIPKWIRRIFDAV